MEKVWAINEDETRVYKVSYTKFENSFRVKNRSEIWFVTEIFPTKLEALKSLKSEIDRKISRYMEWLETFQEDVNRVNSAITREENRNEY